VPSRSHLPEHVSVSSASLGVSSLFTTSANRVHHPPDVPRPTSFRPQRFARSRRFPPRSTSRIYFATLPCPGFSLQGLPPTTQPQWFSPPVTLAPLAPPPAGCPAPANVASTSGSCSESWSAVSGGFFRPARHPCPLLRFQLLRACGPKTLGAPSRPLRSRPSRRGTACPPRRWSSAYRSIPVLRPLSQEALPVRAF
jgi:hypothetical protein